MSVNKCLCGAAVSVMVYADVTHWEVAGSIRVGSN
jgi:hypothetical protein